MNIELAVAVALGVVIGGAGLALGRTALPKGIRTLKWLYPAGERGLIKRRLAIAFFYGLFAIGMTGDFRTSSTVAIYVAIGLCGLAVLVATTVVSLMVGKESGFGSWRGAMKYTLAPEGARRRGLASDALDACTAVVMLMFGGIYAVCLIRLVRYLYEGIWFPWLLS